MNEENKSTLDLEAFRARFETVSERKYWRTLEELHDGESFDAFVSEEFPQQALPLAKGVDRRDFMKLMGSSLALAGLAACTPPQHQIIPYVNNPEEVVPGNPLFFATAMPLGGIANGVLVETHMNRPTKIEGNPDHPASLGASDAFMQGSILDLYDPERSQTVRQLGNITTWNEFLAVLGRELTQIRQAGGAGLHILTESITSPTLGAQMRTLLTQMPQAKWHQYEANSRDSVREGTRLAFGSYANVIYDFTKADVVVAIDSDFLSTGPGALRYARDFMSRRRVRRGSTTMNRLYAIESAFTTTGSVADNRLPLKPSDVASFAFNLAGTFSGGASNDTWIKAVSDDLRQHSGRSVVIAGPGQPPEVHAAVHAINSALGNIGQTVFVTDPLEVQPVNELASMRELVTAMNAGQVRVLLILGGNPVYTAPADLKFVDALQKVPLRAHMSRYYDETSANCQWHVPELHYLESWSDARAFDGTVSVIQPMISPLYNGRSPHELLAAMTDDPNSPYDIVRNYWRSQAPGVDFEKMWKKSLHDGAVAGTKLPVRAVSAAAAAAPPRNDASGYQVLFTTDPSIYDGQFANNSWLQELPKPMTHITWDNAALVGPAMARKIGIGDSFDHPGQTWRAPVIEITVGGFAVKAPVWVQPGVADDTIVLPLGYGRERSGKVGNGHGFNAYKVRSTSGMGWAAGVQVRLTGEDYSMASTQAHHSIDMSGVEGRKHEIIRTGTIGEFVQNPKLAPDHGGPDHGKMSLYPEWKSETGYAWGMAIDTSVCVGCKGCVVACHSENNVATVGKDQVAMGREMHWLRIDNYYEGDPANPANYNQPMLCQHCDNAPCEPVCPVEATSHSTEGINEMTYNRCVGTRYCANNCPYKVRRFNYFQYSDYKTESLKAMRNPDVTVRSRGVMEKCTFCVQRVNAARIEAGKDGRAIRDGEIVTACQQACPTQAIVFGNINDPNSEVSQLLREPHAFRALEAINTEARVHYLATVRNPNPALKAGKA